MGELRKTPATTRCQAQLGLGDGGGAGLLEVKYLEEEECERREVREEAPRMRSPVGEMYAK